MLSFLPKKYFAELFTKLRLPAVLGGLLAGIIVGPFALGSFSNFDGKPLVILNETVRQIGEIARVVIFFIAGLHITPVWLKKIYSKEPPATNGQNI